MRYPLCCLLVVIFAFASLVPLVAVQGVEIGITPDGRFFTIDGEPTFLNGVSYYGGCSISTPSWVTADLDDMQADGFNWIRVWVIWAFPYGSGGNDYACMTRSGAIREPYMSRLKTLITECNNRGMIVDCTWQRSDGSEWPSAPTNQTEHLAQVNTLTNELLPYRNVYFDLANEHNVTTRNRFVSLSECGQLIDAVHAIDPDRLCTVSKTGHGAFDTQAELNTFYTTTHCQFFAPHLGRYEDVPSLTVGTVQKCVTWMNNLGFRIPFHLQEPFREDWNTSTFDPTIEDFYRDCTGGKIAEAAGWCLHNGSNRDAGDYRPRRSFDMSNSEGRLYDQFAPIIPPEELTVAHNIYSQIGSTDVKIRRYQAEYEEQLTHDIGRKEGFVWSATVSLDGAGYLTRGPGIDTVSAGNHKVAWCLMIDDNTGNNDHVLTIDVYSSGTLASQQVYRHDFTASNTWQLFVLNFTSTGQQDLELRTYWLDQAYIKCDWIQLAMEGASLESPVIAEVILDPDQALEGQEYVKQLTLQQGDPSPIWHVLQGPYDLQVTNDGLVSGWTPGASDVCDPITIEIQATNTAGSDTESWGVTVRSMADFDNDNDVDQEDFGFFQACLSGTGNQQEPLCAPTDLDNDNDVDLNDFTLFQARMGGPNQQPICP
ncbi:MAG: cellulase family glycosylhydrolase [Planctomycetota bacterium]|nr:MAG: cellulase family glycosylhydrolase [Planctomycetota bacterium]